MLVSIFILLSSYLFTTPDKRARFLQTVYYLPITTSGGGVVYKPRLSELVVANNGWTTEINQNSILEVREILTKGKYELEEEYKEYKDNQFLFKLFTDSYEAHYDNPNFYSFTIRYSYLATTCLFFFFVGLYMLVSLKNENK